MRLLDPIFSKKIYSSLRLHLLTMIALYFCIGENAQGDNTFIINLVVYPEEGASTEVVPSTTAKKGAKAIEQWAEIKPSRKQVAKIVAPDDLAVREVILTQQQTPSPTRQQIAPRQKPTPNVAVNSEVQGFLSSDRPTPLPVAATAPITCKTCNRAFPAQRQKPLPVAAIASAPRTPVPVIEEKPLPVAAIAKQAPQPVIEPKPLPVAVIPTPKVLPPVVEPKPLPVVAIATTPTPVMEPKPLPVAAIPTPKALPPVIEPKPLPVAAVAAASTVERKPLQLTTVTGPRKALPVQEKEPAPVLAQKVVVEKIVPYEEAANGRSPLGILDPASAVTAQRWYLYASATRGLKDCDRVQIVTMEGGGSSRGEEVKKLLVGMGIKKEQIQVIRTEGEKNQAGIIYIFAGR